MHSCTVQFPPIHSYAKQQGSLREALKSFYSDLERENSMWRSPVQAAKKLGRETPRSILLDFFKFFFKHQPISNMKQLRVGGL